METGAIYRDVSCSLCASEVWPRIDYSGSRQLILTGDRDPEVAESLRQQSSTLSRLRLSEGRQWKWQPTSLGAR